MDEQTQPPEESGKAKAASVLADAAVGAATGAARGGVAGAAVGAGKALVKNKHSRRILLGVVGGMLAMTLVVTLIVVMNVIAVLGSFGENKAHNSANAETSAGGTAKDQYAAQQKTDGTIVPVTVYMAYKQVVGDGPDAGKLSGLMLQAGLSANDSDPALGAVVGATGALKMGSDDTSKHVAEQVQTEYKTAFTKYGLDGATADRVFVLARSFALGQSMCGADTTTPAGDAGGGSGGVSAAGLTAEQTQNAAIIIGIAKTVFPAANQKQAALFGIATALQESGMRNINYGDRDSLGIYQQRASWGSAAQRTTPKYAVGKFYQAWVGKLGVTGWEADSLETVVDKVQVPAKETLPKYTAKLPLATSIINLMFTSSPAVAVPADVGAIAGGSGAPAGSAGGSDAAYQACGDIAGTGAVSQDAKALAQQIVAWEGQGKVTFWEEHGTGPNDMRHQLAWIAAGQQVPNCAVHTGILQVITVAVNMFGSIQLTDLNRLCNGTSATTGFAGDPHSGKGGGWAVDIGRLGNSAVNGSDPNDARLLQTLNSLPVTGKFDAGQVQCRPAWNLPNITQFQDSCTHQHVDTGVGRDTVITGPLPGAGK